MQKLVYRHWHQGLDPSRCVSVDGGAPGVLNLSHWPGNRTPTRFRHDLSTGSCILLAEAPDRDEILRGVDTVTNNHWDTDGLCSVLACMEPELARRQAPRLLEAATAGDFSVFTSVEGVMIDLTVTALTRHPESPVAGTRFKHELERRQAQYDYGIGLLPRLLDQPDLHLGWISPELVRIQRDLRALREDEVEVNRFDALDFAIITTDRPLHTTAVNTHAACDRILTIEQREAGNFCSLRLTTLSWFDLDGLPRQRPKWHALIDQLAKATAAGPGFWQAEKLTDPTPSLFYGDAQGEPALCPAATEDVKRIMLGFYGGYPYLPAGV